jgi:beta-glucosidase
MKHQELISKMSLEEKCYLFSGKDFWQTRGIKRLGIPNMTMADGPHGVRKQEGAGDQLGLNASLPATCFPTAATMANSWDPELGEEMARCLGEEAACQGVDVLLGPGLNIKRSPLCGRNFEYFSEDPYLAGKMAAGYIRGIQSYGVSACPKHFAANSQELRRMASDSIVDERTLREIYLTAFEIAVKEADPHAIMTAYNRINGVYANENKHLLRDILKEEWGFRGFAVSDWGGSNDHVAGVAAGSHLEMPTTGGDSDMELLDAVKTGKIQEEWIDQMADELLDVILSTTKETGRKSGQKFDVEKHHEMARKASEQSIVLLKNEGNLLPLKKGVKAALIGDFAETPRYQGAGSSVVHPTKLDCIKDAIKNFDMNCIGFARGYNRTGPGVPGLEEEACKLAEKADVVLLCIGLDEISESEGLDRQHMRLPESQIQLLHKLSKVNENIIILFSAGSAVEMPWLSECKAFVHGYLCGQAGAAALLKVIMGEVNPSGKLAESYPINGEDAPCSPYFPGKERTVEYREGLYVGYRYYETGNIPVLFPFGYGLSYTTFKYSDLSVTSEKAEFTLENTGEMDGAEIAQLYVSAKCNGVYRPIKELKGFQKVFLKSGEKRKVTIKLDDKAFRYFNRETGQFEVEGGEYDILVGASVADIRLSGTVRVAGTDAVSPYNSARLPNYGKGSIKDVSDIEFKELLGHEIPDGHWKGTLDINDAICQMYYAKSRIARFAYKILTNKLKKTEAKGTPDLNLLFIYNMPFRGIAKMTGGMVTMEMAKGILEAVNGHLWKGFRQIARGYFHSGKKKKKAKEMG